MRPTTHLARLARAGFTAPAAADKLLQTPALQPLRDNPLLLDALGDTPDPDLALRSLSRLAESLDAEDPAHRRTLLDTLGGAKPLRDRLLGVLGSSAALGDHLARHPQDWHALVTYEVADMHPGAGEFRRILDEAVRAVAETDEQVRVAIGGPRTAADALRAAYRRCLLTIAARDVCGTADVTQVAAELADLAAATLQTALDIAAAEHPEDAAAVRLSVIGMGKAGGRELNYVSDVDVVFVAEPVEAPGADQDETASLAAATRLASRMMRLCSDTTVEGTIWPVDANLRPEGRNGPLVRTLASHLAYYQRWAKTWEFQALLKARPLAGDEDLGRRYLEGVDPLVWQVADRDNFVTDVQAMRRRVVANIPRGDRDRELKLGPGGLRDVEFAVQLLQLVHGRTDPELRSGNTLEALQALAAGGYIGRADGAALDDAYRFLRTLEHRIQLHRLRRTHLLPEDEEDLRRLGRGLGLRAEPVTELLAERRRHAKEVRRLHEKLFYRPLLDAVARLGPDEAGAPALSEEAARTRLTALGYADPAAALRHLSALASGVSRKAAIQRTLLPVMLGWFADCADPDAGLLAFRRVSDALGKTPWYLRLLRDEGAAAESLARILASGRFAPDLLLRAPEAVGMLGDADGLLPRRRAALDTEVRATVERHSAGDGTPEQAVAAVRGVRRRELFRIAAADVLGLLGTGDGQVQAGSWDEDGPSPVEAIHERALDEGFAAAFGQAVDAAGTALSDVNAAALGGALRVAVAAVERRRGGDPLPTRLAVIGMGRFGGHELGYGSDADVLFVHEPLAGAGDTEATEAANAVAHELRRLLQLPAGDPPLIVDADLRPEGRQGPLARTLASYAAYYRRWSQAWEAQALLRAEPVAGDAELGERFTALIDPLRYPADGLSETDLVEIRRIKARVETERLPRGADPTTHVKIGRGGLADVEWTVQLLQLAHGHRVPELRTTRTRAALAAAAGAGLLDPDDARVLDDAWVEATRVRNAVMLVRGRAGDTFPAQPRELAGVGRLLGNGAGRAGEAIEDYRRLTRRARAVVERVFYDS
ncbi:bifunctional glutamine-synthetase adenylyltransferase/deadenyltransferase [Mangrovactinospora gilvigrisea]|uniref:Bifunctional glutamine synthetase adenylyltransferase/adenylyl-removing enzyme n=1 Tax=Mangrovactinospora gilvigrisea TaxID=1428644 RepID=A0A1J7BRZ7_9ACTN|nr:bifunctional [glutamine synthetase] adenylyltransferase/[glutamine synthetase]-adenylyl-L-tyrosine phosphorylase [Mangrovactinospora gilvigrisea]OIV36233.1 bifunctional glutamine-synthetase adenylyltransferase/deadenyltransferase [Mangrovactinospora gilvigrisea]